MIQRLLHTKLLRSKFHYCLPLRRKRSKAKSARLDEEEMNSLDSPSGDFDVHKMERLSRQKREQVAKSRYAYCVVRALSRVGERNGSDEGYRRELFYIYRIRVLQFGRFLVS